MLGSTGKEKKSEDRRGEKLLRRVSNPVTTHYMLLRTRKLRWKESQPCEEAKVWNG